MKQLANYYAEPLTHLINQSISQGVFHEEMKLAKILPIYQSEDEQLVTNYRPISKIYYRIYGCKQIVLLQSIWMSKITFHLPCNHHHSRKGIKGLRNMKNCCRSIFRSKNAFDIFDHTLLLRKLQLCGIRENLHAWLYSYLNNISQYVHFNDYNSDRKHITHGVPQRSILGSTVFNIIR